MKYLHLEQLLLTSIETRKNILSEVKFFLTNAVLTECTKLLYLLTTIFLFDQISSMVR